MAIGSDGTGWIEFSDYDLARTVGVVALALILFEGGLTSGVIEIRPVLGTSVSLALIATPLCALISGVTAVLLFDFDLKEGLLVGAVLASTDGAAIFALLRNSTLRRRLARTLEGESGLNDPVAVLLVIALIESIDAPRLRPRRRRGAARPAARDRPRGRPRHRLARGPGLPARPARDRRALPGGLAGDGRAGLRRRRRAARLGLPRRLPRRADARLGHDPRPADDRLLPPGPGVGRAARHVPHARPARLPVASWPTSPSRAPCSRSWPRSSRGRWR